MISRLRSITPEEALALVPKALIATGLMAPALIWIVARLTYPPTQPYSPYFAKVCLWSALAVTVGGLLTAGRIPRAVSTRYVDASGITAFALAVSTGILLLIVPVFLLTWRTSYDDLTGWTYPFLNKRWLGALYAIAIGTFILLPVAFRRLVAGSFNDETGASHSAGIVRHSRWAHFSGLIVLLPLIWLLAGPPWHAERHHRPIDFHEQVHLGPLQAIAKGHLPFIGAASTQYGPGAQLLTYTLMTTGDRFTIVGFREANLAFHFIGVLAVGLLGWWLLGFPAAVMILILSMAYSPLSFFSPSPDGTFGGGYGWSNALRYLGVLLVVPIAALTALKPVTRRFSWIHVALGVLWGSFSWVSQENLTSVVSASALLFPLMWLTQTISLRQAVTVIISLLAGFAAWWAPVLIFYAANGEAGAFIGNYFRVARAVAAGFSNSWWTEATDTNYYRAFVWTPWLIIAIAIATLWKLPRLQLRTPLDRSQVRLLPFVAVLAACYATALYRSDGSHLMNTLIALPFVVTIAFLELPAWLSRSVVGRAGIRLLVVGAAFYIYPFGPVVTNLYAGLFKPSMVRFQPLPELPPVAEDSRVAFKRATRYLQDEPAVVAGGGPMRQFLEEMSALRDLVGDRRTYVGGLMAVYTGLVYFMGDLTPAATLLERETMTINAALGQEVLRDLRGRLKEIDCVIVRELEAPEAVMFLAAHPDANIEKRMLAGHQVFVVLSPATTQ